MVVVAVAVEELAAPLAAAVVVARCQQHKQKQSGHGFCFNDGGELQGESRCRFAADYTDVRSHAIYPIG